MYQGIWCQNQNYDPVTEDGLVINCNDFRFCTYNIGVQTPFINGGGIYPPYYIATNWQSNFSQYCFNGGIATTQGIASSQNNNLNVRNTYQNVQGNGNENKFYVSTPWSTPPIFIHGNFLEPVAGPKFGVGPQPAYSVSDDVNNVAGLSAPALKSTYCPDLIAQSSSPSAFTHFISGMNGQINQALLDYFNNLDGGNTLILLNAIHSPQLNTLALKDQLLAKVFLSDTVLLSYFTPNSVPHPYLQVIFEKNAPVSRKVWQTIIQRNLPAGLMAALSTKQEENRHSDRSTAFGKISLMKNERSYAIMHKSMAFLEDVTAGHVKDSVAELIRLNNQGDVAKQLIELDFTFKNYDAAAIKLSTYSCAISSQQIKYRDFKNLLIDVLRDELQLYCLLSNSARKTAVETVASDYDHPCMLEARNILSAVFDKFYPEQKLMPQRAETPPAERKIKEEPESTSGDLNEIFMENGVNLYPNPASTELFVQNSSEADLLLKITTASGQVIGEYAAKARQLSKINTSGLPNGIYFVILEKDKRLLKTFKLVIAN